MVKLGWLRNKSLHIISVALKDEGEDQIQNRDSNAYIVKYNVSIDDMMET